MKTYLDFLKTFLHLTLYTFQILWFVFFSVIVEFQYVLRDVIKK